MYRVMDLCNLYDFYTSVFTLAFTPCTFNVLFYVRIKYYNNNNNSDKNSLGLLQISVRYSVQCTTDTIVKGSSHAEALFCSCPVLT